MLDEAEQIAVIRGLREGNRDAWTALYDGYSADVWRYVARLVGDRPADVSDIVQETMIAAAKGVRQFDAGRGSLWGWVAGIAHRQMSLHWRKVSREMRLKQLAQLGAGELRRWLEGASREDEFIQRHDLIDLVRFVLSRISADYAQLLVAKYLDDRSLEELAVQFGGTIEGMKSKLARARREFRAELEQLALDPQEVG